MLLQLPGRSGRVGRIGRDVLNQDASDPPAPLLDLSQSVFPQDANLRTAVADGVDDLIVR